MRKLNKKILLVKSLFYRPLILIFQTGITYLYYKTRGSEINIGQAAIEISIIWNIINSITYYFYDVAFLSVFKAGEDDDKKNKRELCKQGTPDSDQK